MSSARNLLMAVTVFLLTLGLAELLLRLVAPFPIPTSASSGARRTPVPSTTECLILDDHDALTAVLGPDPFVGL